ncbi:MAG: hypothetical protein ACREMB_06970 [Candidatus Rokuibacteriota bacterium]
MRGGKLWFAGMVMAVALLAAGRSDAGPNLGTFSWKLEPFNSIVTLTVVQEGPVFMLAGFVNDGGPRLHPTTGVAFSNPDGTVGIGLTSIYPGGVVVHTEATLPSAATPSGSWTNSFDESGDFALQ